MRESWKWAIEERQHGTFLLSNGGYPIAVLSSAGPGHIIDTAAKFADALNAHDRRASPTPPTTEGREEALEAAKRVVEEHNETVAALSEYGERSEEYSNAKAELDWALENGGPLIARALLSSPRVEDVRREERERIARIFEGQTHSEWLGQEAADMIRSLSPPDGDGKQEQATRAEDGPTAPTDRL